jgi:hypothetical protein
LLVTHLQISCVIDSKPFFEQPASIASAFNKVDYRCFLDLYRVINRPANGIYFLILICFIMNKNRLTRTQVQELISHYKTQVWDQRGVFPDGQGDAGSIWFDLQSVKEFIEEIDQHNATKAETEDDKINGIRFYYGAYPEGFANTPPSYTNRHTLVFVATFRQKNGILRCDDEGKEVAWGSVDPMNFGFPCPPDCGGGGGGAVIAKGIYSKAPKALAENL